MIDITIKRAKTNPRIFINDIDETPKDNEDFNLSHGYINIPIKTVKIHLPTIDLKDLKNEACIDIKIT